MADEITKIVVEPLKPERAGINQAVLHELQDIIERRKASGTRTVDLDEAALAALHNAKPSIPEAADDQGDTTWIRNCHGLDLFGICISGGGIRSATFGLGILQGLSEKGLLAKADYISTVSGGGYIGAWLQGLAHRNPDGYNDVLKPKRVPEAAAKDPITFLRKYSNYLAPRNGLSLDALVIPLIWFRNIALNQSIIIAAFMALFIGLLLPGSLLRRIATDEIPYSIVGALAALMMLAAGTTVFKIGPNLRRIVQREFENAPAVAAPVKKQQTLDIGKWIVLPLLVAVLSLIFLAASKTALLPAWLPVWLEIISGGVVLWILVISLQVGGGFCRCYVDQRKTAEESVHKWLPVWHVIWMSLLTTIFLLGLIWCIWTLTKSWDPSDAYGSQLVIAWALPLYLLAIIVGIGLQIGLMGRDFPDASREWLIRLGALLVTFLLLWAGFFAVAIFVPLGVAKLLLLGKNWLVASGTGAWIMSTILSVLAGKSGKSGALDNSPQQKKQSTTIDLVARYGPFIAIAGFLAAVAFGTQLLLHPVPWNARGTFLEVFVPNYWDALPFTCFSWKFPLVLLGFLLFICGVLSWRVNINEFSMHHFYKNRLVRCYLGASATKTREGDLFTGFDPKDDMPLYKLRHTPEEKHLVPYPIVNAALTVTAGTELATQERKALPWFFTPHYSGFFPARSDKDHTSADSKFPVSYADSKMLGKGIALGTATGISGAAANPNSGFHSSPQTAFLLTLFNVRLGWWLGNPTKGKAVKRSGPLFALWWLGRELLGFVDERSFFLNLSDGGHFENLGLYELVRRRCRYIIAIDGEEDKDYKFESLGGAVRKCRTDFGVEIEIDPQTIAPPKDKLSRCHCVVGRIYYPEEDYPGDAVKKPTKEEKNDRAGFLLYMKSSITGDEPADVEEYRRENPDFPQQTTGDQFFSESQFESYRRLGLHVARTTLDHIHQEGQEPEQEGQGGTSGNDVKNEAGAGKQTGKVGKHKPYLHRVFKRLESQWLMPPEVAGGVYSHHGESYQDLLKAVAGCDGGSPQGGGGSGTGPMPDSVRQLDKGVINPEEMPPWAKESEEGRRRFYFYLQLLQLIEDVFVDLDFGNAYKWNHPATKGWNTVITYWAQQDEMKQVWKLQKDNYGQPFHSCFSDLVRGIEPVPPDQRR